MNGKTIYWVVHCFWNKRQHLPNKFSDALLQRVTLVFFIIEGDKPATVREDDPWVGFWVEAGESQFALGRKFSFIIQTRFWSFGSSRYIWDRTCALLQHSSRWGKLLNATPFCKENSCKKLLIVTHNSNVDCKFVCKLVAVGGGGIATALGTTMVILIWEAGVISWCK